MLSSFDGLITRLLAEHAATAADRARQGRQDFVDRLRTTMDAGADVENDETITEPSPAPRRSKPRAMEKHLEGSAASSTYHTVDHPRRLPPTGDASWPSASALPRSASDGDGNFELSTG
jgi:hypothetical protein